jgi:hypothetical protein
LTGNARKTMTRQQTPEQPRAVELGRSRPIFSRGCSIPFASRGRIAPPRFLGSSFARFLLCCWAIVSFPTPLAGQEKPARSIVFLAPEAGDPEVEASLRESIAAQLSDVLVRPVFDRAEASSDALVDFAERGGLLARSENAAGVFWLDAANQDDWKLYLLDPDGERLLVRGVGSSVESFPAAVEAVGVIVRGSAIALLYGQALGRTGEAEVTSSAWVQIGTDGRHKGSLRGREEDPVGEKGQDKTGALLVRIKTPSTAGAGEDPEGTGFRLAAAYRGSDFATQTGWQSGVGLWAGWVSVAGLYAGAGYTFTGSESVRRDPVQLSVQRHPIELFGGYRFGGRIVRFDAELGAVFDVMSRRAGVPQAGFAASQDRSRLVFGLAPRTRVEYAPFGGAALYAGLGVSFFANNFEYVGDFVAREVLLGPRPVRVEIEAGLAVYLR